ncbi:uncharacterized protein MYCFIDRAFT_212937 [Pseudocercospora fijiensis CIRAD86]|uniref:Uncharacterized protein n=1 Tax=Pseudocercospora fijiensis (strain CIRAD86) TaxID=383855 RepID=N1Q619_PSEFD|nr:uncharacterized protein MYCFIDRAFT_212937 [Pseudocercospora fijiensis CIRAD86]EME87569.1 hypothetical protein MYCFIDRAFT_212937 [Pseudocercospora fijiensis CIRAD86]
MAADSAPPPSLYQETRVSFAPASPNTTLHINTAGNSSSSALVPFSAGRKRGFDEISGNDEEAFARKHLATEGSVFFRSKGRSPRSFVWRVLNDRRLLELRCVDIVHDRHSKSECWLTYKISFQDKILPNGVVLADSTSKDELDIFILSGDDLFTIALPKHLLVRETAPTDFDSTTAFKKFSPATFHGQRPYRIIAVSNLELFVSLQDGSLMRLEREPNQNGGDWRVTFFSEGGWSGSLRRTLPWARQTIKFGDLTLDTNACAAIAKSPDAKYIWTVGLNHTLKAWSVETGGIIAQMDMLDDRKRHADEKRKQANYAMGAEQGTLLQIVSAMGVPDVLYFIVLQSPKEHEFKFYAIKSDDIEPIKIHDTQANQEPLIAPIAEMLDTNIWHLADFTVSPGRKWQNNQIWIRARSGAVCRTFMLNFNLIDDTNAAIPLADLWKRGWSIVKDSSASIEIIKQCPDYIELDPSVRTIAAPNEKWLAFIFYPGRFTEASLETALHIYRKGRNLPASTGRSFAATEEPLEQRLITAVTSKILLRRTSNDQPDYDTYHLDLQAQWQTFFSLLSHIHTRRHEVIGSAFDPEGRLPWTICADFVAPLRLSSEIELLSNNSGLVINGQVLNEESQYDDALMDGIWPHGKEDMTKSGLFAVAEQFRHYLSPTSQERLRSAAVQDALIALPNDTIDDSQLKDLCDHCAFSDDITDEDFQALNDSASAFNGLGCLTDDVFLAVTEGLVFSEVHGAEFKRTLVRFGKDIAIAIAQETIQRIQRVLLDLMALVIFMYADLEDLSMEFRPLEVYDNLRTQLKRSEYRSWLVAHQSGRKNDDTLMTLYEHLFLPDWNDIAKEAPSAEMPELLTAWNRDWVFALDLKSRWEEITDWIMSKLLKEEQNDLAADFIKFLSQGGSWTTYLQGRLLLATGEYDLAASSFRDAAKEMSSGLLLGVRDNSAHLLDATEVNLLGGGMDKYFEHIMSLFESLKVFSYTAEFAQAALNNIKVTPRWRQQLAAIDLRKSQNKSPAPQQIDDAMEEIHLLRVRDGTENLLSRLFNAWKETGRFEDAHSVLETISDPNLQRQGLCSLIDKCIKQDAVPVLLSLPISDDLVQYADAELLRLAKRSMGTSNAAISGPPYHQILFAFRTQIGDFRGAAALLYLHLEHLKATKTSIMMDPDDETLVQVYVLLISTLACCAEDEAWLLADPLKGVHPSGAKRRLVRLEDIRREYAAELDKRSDIEQGRFALVGGDEMDML